MTSYITAPSILASVLRRKVSLDLAIAIFTLVLTRHVSVQVKFSKTKVFHGYIMEGKSRQMVSM